MTVADKNGVELKTGDLVTITAVVTQTFEGDGNNIVVETCEAISGSHPATFHTEGKKLTAVVTPSLVGPLEPPKEPAAETEPKAEGADSTEKAPETK